jgi:hypothetical protein
MLPISVVVPHKSSRREFFAQRCFPSILLQGSAEIIVIPNQGELGPSGGPYRNIGFGIARQPYIIFVDDDTVLYEGCLQKLWMALEASEKEDAIAYCNFMMVDQRVTKVIEAGVFTREALAAGNSISTISLIRTVAMVPFDFRIQKLDDWSHHLTMVSRGWRGVKVAETLFEAHKIDVSVSDLESDDNAIKKVKELHGLP